MTARLVKRVTPPQEQTLRRVRPPAAPRRLGEPPQERRLLDSPQPQQPILRRVRPPAAPRRRGEPPQDRLLDSPQPAAPLRAAPLMAASPPVRTSDELATGRGLTNEWEVFMADVLDRLGLLEDGVPLPAFVYSPSVPAATWSITHNLGTKPHVVIVAADGSELIAEVDYPDNQTTVITFGQPYAGTAYLRG